MCGVLDRLKGFSMSHKDNFFSYIDFHMKSGHLTQNMKSFNALQTFASKFNIFQIFQKCFHYFVQA